MQFLRGGKTGTQEGIPVLTSGFVLFFYPELVNNPQMRAAQGLVFATEYRRMKSGLRRLLRGQKEIFVIFGRSWHWG